MSRNSESGPPPNNPLAAPILAGTMIAALFVGWVLLGSGGQHLSPPFRVLLWFDLVLLAFIPLTVLLAMVLARRGHDFVGAVEGIGSRPLLVGSTALLMLGIAAPLVYRFHPLSMDEIAAHFQSEVFAAGRLTGNFPVAWMSRLIAPAFQGVFVVVSPVTGDVISIYFPGFALLMAPFSALGLSWLCNPLVTAVTIPAMMHTMRLLQPGRPAAVGWAVAFTLCSPAVLVLGVSYYAMPALMLANIVYTWGFFNPRPSKLFWTGVVGSVALILHNPFPHILFAIPWVLWLIRSRGLGREFAALVIGYLPLSLLLGLGWMMLRRHVAALPDPGEAAGAVQLLFDHARQAFVLPGWSILIMRSAGLAKLWLWAVPGLLVLAALGWWKDRSNVHTSLLAASALLTFAGYFAVPFDQGHGWGYRYFHSAWFVLPLLAATYVSGGDAKQAPSMKCFLAALLAVSMVLLAPFYLYASRAFVSESIEKLPVGGSIGSMRVTFVYPRGMSDRDLVANDPFLRGDDLYLLGSSPEEDARTVQSLSPDARIVASTSTATMWQLPLLPAGMRELLLKKNPPPE